MLDGYFGVFPAGGCLEDSQGLGFVVLELFEEFVVFLSKVGAVGALVAFYFGLEDLAVFVYCLMPVFLPLLLSFLLFFFFLLPGRQPLKRSIPKDIRIHQMLYFINMLYGFRYNSVLTLLLGRFRMLLFRR